MMKKFNVLEVGNIIEFRLKLNEEMTVSFHIKQKETGNEWHYFLINKLEWETFHLSGDTFYAHAYLEKANEIRIKVENGFYELLRQIKNHPSYRLKVMHILTDEMRELWDAV
jgi:hypothetical protein